MHLLGEGIDADVLAQFKKTLEALTKQGFEIQDISLPALSYALAVYYIIMPAEVSSNMARFDGLRYGHFAKGENVLESYALSRKEGFGTEVRRRIMLGTYVLSAGYYDAYYGKAVGARRLIKEEFTKAFTAVDAIALPVAPTPAFLIGERTKDPLTMYAADIFTVSANLAGIPAISIPAGTVSRDGKDLPVGFQLMAPNCCEDRLFSVGKIIESLG
jgi:aspartyl-tRNA(Asn)/glutamyl-tRNA(Gln) amidotransferase subunit A